jgi:hypothetical protein
MQPAPYRTPTPPTISPQQLYKNPYSIPGWAWPLWQSNPQLIDQWLRDKSLFGAPPA